MLISRKIINWCIISSIAFLFITLILEKESFRTMEIIGIRMATLQNIMLGLFGSIVVSGLISFANYLHEKNKFLTSLRHTLEDVCYGLSEIKKEFVAPAPSQEGDLVGVLKFFQDRTNKIETHLKIINGDFKKISTADYDGFFKNSRMYLVVYSLDDLKMIINQHLIHAIQMKIDVTKLGTGISVASPGVIDKDIAQNIKNISGAYFTYQSIFVEAETRAIYALNVMRFIERRAKKSSPLLNPSP